MSGLSDLHPLEHPAPVGKPALCPSCWGARVDLFTSRQLPCPPCKGTGVTRDEEKPDTWSRYRAEFGIPLDPAWVVFVEAMDEQLD